MIDPWFPAVAWLITKWILILLVRGAGGRGGGWEQSGREDDACWISASTIILLCTSWLQPAHGAAQYSCRVNSVSTANDVRKVGYIMACWKVKAACQHHLNHQCWMPNNGLHFPLPWKPLFLCDNMQPNRLGDAEQEGLLFLLLLLFFQLWRKFCSCRNNTAPKRLPVPPPFNRGAQHMIVNVNTQRRFSAVVFTWIGWTR